MTLFVLPQQVPVNSAGQPLAFAKLYFYKAGTLNAQAVYNNADLAGGHVHPQPVQADATGTFPIIYLDYNAAFDYRVQLKTAADVLIDDQDNYPTDGLQLFLNNLAAASIESTQVKYDQTDAEQLGSVTPTIDSREPDDARRYGLVGSATPDAAAWASWSAVLGNSGAVYDQLDNFRWNRVEPTNFGIGKNALISCPLGQIENVGIGESALASLTTGIGNLALGYSALAVATNTNFCTSLGVNSMLLYTTGLGFSVAIGYGAYARGITGYNNVAIGFEALHNNGTGINNVAIGSAALHSGTNVSPSPAAADPSSCVAIGTSALEYAYGSSNIGIGSLVGTGPAGYASGDKNIFIGAQAATNFTTLNNSVLLGYQTNISRTTGTNDVLIGYQAAFSQTTSPGYNVLIGALAGYYNTTSTQNVGIGYNALGGTSGQDGSGGNTAIGYAAMQLCGNPSSCVAIGQLSLRVVSTGTANIGIGDSAGVALTTGGHNVSVGNATAPTLTTGSNNVCIGDASNVSAAGATNQNSIGYSAACTGDNQMTLGNASIATLRCQQTTITALSDVRFKKNVKPIDVPDAFIDEIEIVSYEWIASDMPKGQQMGVIAQQLDALQEKYGLQWLGLVDKTNPDRWEATPGKLLFPLILRTQKLVRKVAALEAKCGI